jgi:hypothetical protein
LVAPRLTTFGRSTPRQAWGARQLPRHFHFRPFVPAALALEQIGKLTESHIARQEVSRLEVAHVNRAEFPGGHLV